jgi:hypothetical protein
MDTDHHKQTVFRLQMAPCMIPPKPWSPRVMVYADDITEAVFAGPPFAKETDCLVIRGYAREWLIDGEFGVLLSNEAPSNIETVGLEKQTADGWVAEVVQVEGSDIVVLVAPGASLFGGSFAGWQAVTKFWVLPSAIGWGFSPSGRSLVLAGPGWFGVIRGQMPANSALQENAAEPGASADGNLIG